MKDRHSSGGLPVEEMAETGMCCNSVLVYSSQASFLCVYVTSHNGFR